MTSDDSPDLTQALVQRIQEGDSSAWEGLYLRYRDALLLSIRCRLGGALRARLQSEDVLHSVMKDAMRDLAAFEYRGKDTLLHWLHVCALRKIRNKATYFGAAKRQGDQRLSDTLAERLPHDDREPSYLDLRYDDLERALGQLPEALQEVILLRKIEGLSNAEAAQAMGKSPEAASKLFNRAVARLAMLMKGSD